MPISEADVRHTMALAHLRLPDGDVTALTKDLQAILQHVDTLKAVDVVKDTARHASVGTPLRDDKTVDGVGSAGLQGSAGRDGHLVKVPRIME